MLKNVVVLLLPFLLVSCFESEKEEEKNDHATGLIPIYYYRQVSDEIQKTTAYWYDGSVVTTVESSLITTISKVDTIGFNTPYLGIPQYIIDKNTSTNEFMRYRYSFDREKRMVQQNFYESGDYYIDSVFSQDSSQVVCDTLVYTTSNDTLYEHYTKSTWIDTLGHSFVGIRKEGVRIYHPVESYSFPDFLWYSGLDADAFEPDSKEEPITGVTVYDIANTTTPVPTTIFSLSKDDTDYFEISCTEGKKSLVYIETGMQELEVSINDIKQLKHSTVNPIIPGFELLSVFDVMQTGSYILSLSDSEGLYRIFVVESE